MNIGEPVELVVPQGDPVVFSHPLHLSDKYRLELQSEIQATFPTRRVLLLTDGATMANPAQWDRIEAKLDALLKAIAEDEEESGENLDGTTVPISTAREQGL